MRLGQGVQSRSPDAQRQVGRSIRIGWCHHDGRRERHRLSYAKLCSMGWHGRGWDFLHEAKIAPPYYYTLRHCGVRLPISIFGAGVQTTTGDRQRFQGAPGYAMKLVRSFVPHNEYAC